MDSREKFTIGHSAFLKKIDVDKTALPASLQVLISKYENAVDAYLSAERNVQEKLAPIISNTCAVIASEIHKAQPPKPVIQEEINIDKLKMLELEAAALKLKFLKR